MNTIVLFDRAHISHVFGPDLERLIHHQGDGHQLWDAFTECLDIDFQHTLDWLGVDESQFILEQHHLLGYFQPHHFLWAVLELCNYYRPSLEAIRPKVWDHVGRGGVIEVVGYWEYMLTSTPVIHVQYLDKATDAMAFHSHQPLYCDSQSG